MRPGGFWHSYMRSTDDRPQMTWGLLRRVFGYARPYWGGLALTLILILVTSGLSLIRPLILRDLIDRTLPSRDYSRLGLWAASLLLIPAVTSALNVWQRRINAQIGEGVIFNLRVALYAHLQKMSLRFFTHTKTGELMSRLNNDVVGAQNAISNTFVDITTNFVQVVVLLGMMLALEWRLTLLSIGILPFFVVAARRLGTRLRDITRQQLDYNAHMNAMMNETLNISGALLVKLFGHADTEVARFDGHARRVRDSGIQRAVTGSLFMVSVGLLGAVGTALVYGLGGFLAIQGAFTVGTIIAFGTYLASLYSSMQSLANAPVDFASSVVSFERVFEVLDLPLEIVERPDAYTLRAAQGALEFEDVTFRYAAEAGPQLKEVRRFGRMEEVAAVFSGDEKGRQTGDEAEPGFAPSQARVRALDHITFRVEPGQLVALVGPSGAGKTTLTYLIPRLYDPTAGRILLDHHDLRNVTLDSLTAQVGMVTQETHLFHDTIRTNLLYARLDASREEVEAAARAANIHDFVMGLPNRYDTVVGERGYRLSALATT